MDTFFSPQHLLIHYSTAVPTLDTIWSDLCQVNYREIKFYALKQRCTNPGCQIAMTIRFYKPSRLIFGGSEYGTRFFCYPLGAENSELASSFVENLLNPVAKNYVIV